MNLKKYVRTGHARLTERLHIKSFKTNEEAYAFLGKQTDNKWSECTTPETQTLKTGVYAFAGGKWHNVKHLDPSVLAHI